MTIAVRPGLMVAALCVVSWGVACAGGQQEEAPAPPAATTKPADAATSGSIVGTIKLQDNPPPPQPISMNEDAYCQSQPPQVTETITVGRDSALQNVFVYVKDGLGDRTFPVPTTPVVLDQKGCRYVPHVFGIQVGQTLEILSSDNTLHNVHAVPQNNREFNKAHQLAGIKHTHVFSTKEVMVPFKCDVHRWMNAYLGVVDHPFFAVTGADGAFELNGLPPGTYTVEAWHEKLGTQTQTITVDEKQTSTVAFTFRI